VDIAEEISVRSEERRQHALRSSGRHHSHKSVENGSQTFFRVTKSARNGINLTSFLLPVSQHHFTFCLLKWRGL
jgi:hypothetical protein